MTFAQRRNFLMTHFSERIPVVKRRISLIRLRDTRFETKVGLHVMYITMYKQTPVFVTSYGKLEVSRSENGVLF